MRAVIAVRDAVRDAVRVDLQPVGEGTARDDRQAGQ
jgi:hypothetical protein